jgi:hypothetical protein
MMNPDEDRIDFSALDPARDARRWEAMIRTTAAMGRMRRAPGFAWQVSRWARPAVGLAASFALVLWGVALFRGTSTPAFTSANATWQLLEWAQNDQVPAESDPTEIFRSSQ